MSIPGSVSDCQLARRVSEELYNDSRSLAAPSGIQRREGTEKSGSEEPLQPMPLPSSSGKAKEESLDGMLKSESSFFGDASGEIPRPYGISELHCELPNRGLLECKESHARCSGSRKSKQPNR